VCGFAGVINKQESSSRLEAVLARMGDAIAHRGPDDCGTFVLEAVGLGMVHRRLSVIDLSPNGRQPMKSGSGRYVLAYNGEIYNFARLRNQLISTGTKFRTGTDTEVLLNGIQRWGLESTLHKLEGMFAFALIDLNEGVLYLVRDRIGEKPLYYGWQNGVFLFGSELAAMRQHPKWAGGTDKFAMSEMLQLGYVPLEGTIHPNVYKVPAGGMISVALLGHEIGKVKHRRWWSYQDCVQKNYGYYSGMDALEIEHQVDMVLRQVVSDQNVADVPIGAFLSGGIDSSLVVAYMQEISSQPIRTFSLGFENPGYSEIDVAEKVAHELGTTHQSLVVTPQDAGNIIPDLCEIYDEPFADSSQIPTVLISRLASQRVKVALSGDGGDEMFGGYNRYKWAPLLFSTFSWSPKIVRRGLSNVISSIAAGLYKKEQKVFPRLIGEILRFPQLHSKMDKVSSILTLDSQQEIYESLTRDVMGGSVFLDRVLPRANQRISEIWNQELTFAENMMLSDAVTYLPDDILVKVDRGSMSAGLEVRAPLIDHRMIQLASRLPIEMKLAEGKTKWILRRILSRKITPDIINRPKSGFAVPIGDWLKGPLRTWSEDTLSNSTLESQKLFDTDVVQALWSDHLSGLTDNSRLLWNILMFQSWFNRYEGLN
jgi:asparagine synthase (glutamine-hydrolysing)